MIEGIESARLGYRFNEHGGYDCMTDSVDVHVEGNPAPLFVLDLGRYGQTRSWDSDADKARARSDAEAVAERLCLLWNAALGMKISP